MCRYWYDCEFIDDGHTIDLISIGIVCEDGRELYCQHVNYDASKASEWVQENVLTHLEQCEGGGGHLEHSIRGGQCMGKYLACGCPWYTQAEIKSAILRFMDIEKYGKPELWGYYSAYDHVAFCQLFGTMMDLPKGFPMLTYDLRQWLDMNGKGDVHQPDNSVHNSLEDARWVAETYKRLVR